MVSRKKQSRRSKEPSEQVREATERVRDEAREVVERDRRAARKARAEARAAKRRAPRRQRTGTGSGRLQDAGLEARRLAGAALSRLRPPGSDPESALARVAPHITGALMLLVRIPAALIATLLDVVTDAGRWARARIGPILAAAAEIVTPVRTVAFVSSVAAVALAASEFVDYRGIAVASELYEGEIGSVAPAPLTALEHGGSAHAYVMIPLALVALGLIAATLRGRWRLGRAIGLVGLVAIAVGLLIDMPRGLDSGRSGVAYSGIDARLIEGFWTQLAAGAALLYCGPLLGRYVRIEAEQGGPLREGRRRRRRAPKRRRDRSRRSARAAGAPRQGASA